MMPCDVLTDALPCCLSIVCAYNPSAQPSCKHSYRLPLLPQPQPLHSNLPASVQLYVTPPNCSNLPANMQTHNFVIADDAGIDMHSNLPASDSLVSNLHLPEVEAAAGAIAKYHDTHSMRYTLTSDTLITVTS